MDLKSKNKVLNIILSILIILTILGSAVGFAYGGVILSEYRMTSPEYGVLASANIQEIFKSIINFFEANQHVTFDNAYEAASFINNLLTNLAFLAAFLACGIIILINSIILFVQAIKSFSKPVPSGKLTRRMLTIVSCFGIYIAVLLGLIYEHYPSYHITVGLGIGPLVQLGVCGMYLIITSIIHIVVRDDRKVVGKIFQVVITLLAFATLLILFIRPYDLGEMSDTKILPIAISYFSYLVTGAVTDQIYMIALAFIGCVFIIVSFFSLAKLIKAPMGADDPDKKAHDYGKSAIVRCSVFLGLFAIGFSLLSVGIMKLVEPTKLKLGIPGILCIVFGVTLLALCIVSKAVDKGPVADQPQGPVDAVKEEIAKFVPEKKEEESQAEVLEEPAGGEDDLQEGTEDHEKKEEVFFVQEAPAEEKAPKEEASAGPKFCPNCGAPVQGKKFCPNCGTKLI